MLKRVPDRYSVVLFKCRRCKTIYVGNNLSIKFHDTGKCIKNLVSNINRVPLAYRINGR